MKRFSLLFSFIQLPVDFFMLVLAGFSAYTLRYTSLATSIRPILFNLHWQKYWPIVLSVSAAWIVIFAFSGLYNTNPNRKLTKELSRVVMACSTGFAAITIYVFFTLQKFDSRFLVLASWILAILFVCAGRIALRLIKMLCYQFGIGARRTVIIGNQKIADDIRETLLSHPSMGYTLLGVYENFSKENAQSILRKKPDEIIFTDPKATEEDALYAIDFANEHHISFKYSADIFSTISANMTYSTIAGIPIVELGRTRLVGWGKIIKRLMDIVGSLILIIISSPVYLILAIIILIETGRPIIYKNERVGQVGKKFFAYKFRSLYQKYCIGTQFANQSVTALAEEKKLIKTQNVKDGPVYKIKDDPRVTPFGRFIRKWSLDEIPQFFNVLKGEMSLVGPRPHQPREVEKYQKWHRGVLAIRPGITGMAQISGRSDLTFDEEAKLDIFYIEHWSLIIDIIILIKTPFVVILRKGAW